MNKHIHKQIHKVKLIICWIVVYAVEENETGKGMREFLGRCFSKPHGHSVLTKQWLCVQFTQMAKHLYLRPVCFGSREIRFLFLFPCILMGNIENPEHFLALVFFCSTVV